MINWNFLAPRLAIVASLLLFLAFALDPLARWSLVEVGQRTIGAKIEIASVSSSFVHAQVAVDGIAFANPHRPEKNLFAAQSMYLDLDVAALSQRRIVIEQGVVQGLVIDGARADSGEVNYDYDIDISLPQLGDAGEKMLLDAAKMLGEHLADDLESVQLARELAARWPQEYRNLEAGIERWLSEVRELQKLPEMLGRDPLADAQRVQRAVLTLQTLKEELVAMRGDFQRLQQQAKIDRGALTAAVERDVTRIEERLKAASLDPQKLTEYLLGPEVAPRVREAIVWAKWAHEHIPDEDLPEPARARGVDVSFATAADEPWFIAKALRVEGEIVLDDRRIPFVALASGITSQPRRYGRPTIFRVKLNDPVETWIELTIDRSQRTRREQLSIVCPQVPMPLQQLGSAEKFALRLSPGPLAVQLQMTVAGDAIAGDLQLRRSSVALDLSLNENLGGKPLAERVARSLRDIHQIDLHVALSGTLEKPQVRLNSPLGDQLVAAIRSSIDDEISLRRVELREKARSAIEVEISGFQERLAVQKQLALKKLSLANDEQQQLEALIANSFGLPNERLGRQLLRSLDR